MDVFLKVDMLKLMIRKAVNSEINKTFQKINKLI